MMRKQKQTRRRLFLEALEDRSCPSSLPIAAPLAQPDAATQARASAAYGQLPLSFEANQGQTDATVNFLSRGSGYTLFLTPGEAVLSLGAGQGNDVVRMRIVGADPNAQSAGLEAQAGRTSYLLGDDSSQWHTEVANYGKVEYQDVYSGIDLVYYGNQRRLEYDFVVAPGADPNVIQLAFDGVRSMELDAGGNLILHTAGGDLVKDAPVVYQESDGARSSIAGRYLLDDGQVSFEVGAYDHALPLVIDPILSYSTYLGGSGVDVGFAIAVDSAGSAYVTGTAGSSSFPKQNPMQPKLSGGNDAFVTKFNAAGSGLVYSTYFGGSGSDRGYGIAVDGNGYAYVTGLTTSSNLTTTVGAFDTTIGGGIDAFVVKLNAGGSALLYSTYFGGSGGENFNTPWRTGGIAVDGAGNAYITGKTNSLDLLTTTNAVQPAFGGGDFDAFVAKFDTTKVGAASLVYATYLGGSGDDESTGIAVDSAGNAYLTGWTGSSNFQTPNGFQTTRSGYSDAFVAKLNSTGSALLYSTFLGGSGNEFAGGIALDTSGNAYVTGRTSVPTATPAQPADFPTLNAFQPQYGGGLSDAFVAKLNPNLTGAASLVYSSYLGGSGDDNPNDNRGAIAVDASGNAYVTGVAYSTDFPTVNAIQATPGGDYDAFVTKVNAAGSALLYSSYLGGSGDDRGFGIAVSTISGNTFAYVTGLTVSSNFPTVNAFQPRRAGGGFPWDAFVTKISFGAALVATSSAPAMSEGTTATALTLPHVQPLLDEAIQRWLAAGVDTSILNGIDVRIADLGGATLGLASGHTITLDDNAAGWGWFVDPTPWDDSEFTTPGNQGEQNRMDLLTVLEHELGHLLGKEHEATGVMIDTLPTGTRRVPSDGIDTGTRLDGNALFIAFLDAEEETTWIGSSIFGRGRHKR